MARRNYRARISIKIDLGPLEELRRNWQAVLKRLDEPCRQVTNLILDQSLFMVPRGGAPDDQVDLADTAFKDGPVYNPRTLSTTWSCGYWHPAAGAIEAGWHFGDKTKPPPDFLRNAAKRGARTRLKKLVAIELMKALKVYAPSRP